MPRIEFRSVQCHGLGCSVPRSPLRIHCMIQHPLFEIEVRPSAKVFGDLYRFGWVGLRYNAGADRLLNDLEHRLSIRSRVGKIETLIDDGEVCNDVSLDCFDQGRPVIERRILNLAALQMIVSARANPMDDFAAPSLDGAQRAAVRGNGRDFRTEVSVETLIRSAPDDAQRFIHLVDPHLQPMAYVANVINGYPEGVATIRRIRVIAPSVQIHP